MSSCRKWKAGCGAKSSEAVLLERDAVVVVEVVDPDDRVAAREEFLAHVEANEPRRPRHEELRHNVLALRT